MSGLVEELEKAPEFMTSKQSPRHFLDISDLDGKTLRKIIDAAHAMKKAGKRVPKELRPKGIEDLVLAMIFEKPSTRTRVSFDVAMRQLGGGGLVLNHTDLQLGRGESVADTARVLSRYVDGIMIRANAHATLAELAKYATIPVINGLTEKSHPCQVMADIQTFEEHLGPIKGKTVAWVGDGNNVAVSWMHAAVRFGFKLRLACPKALFPEDEAVEWVTREKGDVEIGTDPDRAVKGVDCVVTDTWVSMGQSDAAKRKKMLAPYAVDEKLMSKAAKNAIFMHCLPAYRGHEVSEAVLEGPQSVIFDEAENRLHAQKAILAWCFGA
ncbi:ornithine carbamoyltransferase [Hyphomicrobium sp. B1]|uniref:ornithine carbamoyltransferase n=1 Tax=unclassified Hyphomicrobium TaxID=2619925 RepID=UPI000213F7AF|nr:MULTISPECIES: ornithine carbamoyltransferase [unclassified Hyphomicrobium]CCB63267.1 ornithine carbamoyltransferase [Hyphomicrobium sp. MC1]